MTIPSDYLFQIILFIAGILCAIAIPFLPDTAKKWLAAILAAALIAIAVAWAAATWLTLPPRPSPLEVTDSTAVTITSHQDHDIVPYPVTVTGTFSDIPDNTEIWLYLFAPGNRRYYFDPATLYRSDGTWEVLEARIGREKEDVGATYQLGVMLADKKTSEYLHEKQDIGHESIPGATKTFHTITITREP